MYILEISSNNQREAVLLSIISRIYNKAFQHIEDAIILDTFTYLDHSQYTKTNRIGIQDINTFKKGLWLQSSGNSKLAIINNAHNLTIEAQNALLKDLEEEPDNTLIILALSDKRLLLPTILSRGISIKEQEIHILPGISDKENFDNIVYNRQQESRNLDHIQRYLDLSLFDSFSYIAKNFSQKKGLGEKTKVLSEKEDLVESFLRDLLSYYESRLAIEPETALAYTMLIENGLKKIRKGVQGKIILEHITLTIKHG